MIQMKSCFEMMAVIHAMSRPAVFLDKSLHSLRCPFCEMRGLDRVASSALLTVTAKCHPLGEISVHP